MKNYILSVMLFSFLIQSCTTYKTVSDLSFENGGKYKIKQSEKWIKVKVMSQNDSIVNVEKSDVSLAIAKSTITSVKKREFSVVKTIVLVPVAVSVLAVGSYIANPGVNIPISPSSPN